MKNSYFAVILLLCCYQFTFSQIKFSGVVKDSLGNSLELANVIAINNETSALAAYAITDESGRYSLDLGKNSTYKFQVTYIGMKSLEEIISVQESDVYNDFTLTSDVNLDEIELTYEMPVTIQGDT
ncbi:MAG: carboxypeptidase-like regulatory domain-containing protein, partial [Lutimonas sp.]